MVLGRRSPLAFSTSAALNDDDIQKLLQCKECSVKLVTIQFMTKYFWETIIQNILSFLVYLKTLSDRRHLKVSNYLT